MTEEKKSCFAACKPDLTKPLLPTQEGCKHARVKPVCDPCGCKSQMKKDAEGKEKLEEHMFGKGEGVIWNGKQQCVCFSSMFCFVYFVLFGIIQWGMFHFATGNCGKLPDDYTFVGADPGQGTKNTTAGENLQPKNAYILGREPSIYGEAFDVQRATEVGVAEDAAGTWFRTWGPWFYTYTYQDINSKGTVYMRPTLLGMTGVMSELKVMRCDGKGDVLKLTEGTNVFSNGMRNVFQTNTGKLLKLLINGEQVASVEESFRGAKSITFRSSGKKTTEIYASGLLKGLDNDGFNKWYLKNHVNSPLLFYMTEAVTVNYAFKIALAKNKAKDSSFLASLPGMMSNAKDTRASADGKQSTDLKTLSTNQSKDIEIDMPPVAEVQSEKV